MRFAVRLLAQLSYIAVGAAMFTFGAIVLLAGGGALPGVQRSLLDEAQGNLDFVHVLQEFATLLIFAGLITLWFVRSYDQSMTLHWSLTLFFALLAIVHWFDVRGRTDFASGDVIIGIPLVWFMVLGVLRASAAQKASKSSPSALP